MYDMIRKKNKPKFNVQNLGFTKGVKDRWRKPRGTGNKKRQKEAWAGACPRVGYKNPEKIRGLHPLGLHEILVSNSASLKGVTNKVVRIASSVGFRKAQEIEKAAKLAGLMVLNPRAARPREPNGGKEEKMEKKAREEKKPENKLKAEPGPLPEPSGPTPPAPQSKGGKQ